MFLAKDTSRAPSTEGVLAIMLNCLAAMGSSGEEVIVKECKAKWSRDGCPRMNVEEKE